jgi:hypothetical protein
MAQAGILIVRGVDCRGQLKVFRSLADRLPVCALPNLVKHPTMMPGHDWRADLEDKRLRDAHRISSCRVLHQRFKWHSRPHPTCDVER